MIKIILITILIIILTSIVSFIFVYMSYDLKFKKCVKGCNNFLLKHMMGKFVCKKCNTKLIYKNKKLFIEFKINNDLLISDEYNNRSKVILNYKNQLKNKVIFELSFDTGMYVNWFESNQFDLYFPNIKSYNINKYVDNKKEAE